MNNNELINKALKESLIRSPIYLQRYILHKYKKSIQINEIKKFLYNRPEIEIQTNNKIEDFHIDSDIGSYQADLTFYEQYKHKNKGYIGLLVVIEIPTRLVYIEPIKSKKSTEICEHFTNIIKRLVNPIKNLTMDGGSEFISKDFEEFLNENNITPRYSNPGEKNNTAIVERMNRTIREKIQTHFNITDTLVYYKMIENHDLENAINNSYNRSIGDAPISIKDNHVSENNKELREYNTELYKKLNFNIGDKVRIRLHKGKFDKITNKYSKSVHTITNIYGFSANLDNDETKHYTLNKLKKIRNNKEITNSNDKEIENINKEKKQKRLLKKEGLI